MRAMGWLGLMVAVAALAYTALCLSAPLKDEAHHIEWLSEEEALILNWATSSWSSKQLWPSEVLSKSVWDDVQVAAGSIECPLEGIAYGTGTRKLRLTQSAEGNKLQERVTRSVPFYLRGWEKLRGNKGAVAPIGRSLIAHIKAQSAFPTARAPWDGGAFVPVSLPFKADTAGFQAPVGNGDETARLWCFSFPSDGPRYWQWAEETSAGTLDSALANGGKGWALSADTLALWEALPNAASALAILHHVKRSVEPRDTLEPIWVIQVNALRPNAESRTAPKSETATLFQFDGLKISGQ